ncbi:L-rhamnose mutarotase [Paenibacillus sp. sptzw28]|uniref:L-rhamnose mutarotase n=1 Tax=Paenibacillus sp. sptzw28 TaxID=715179 RepID=UPI001C6E73B7|nr:L-rhamnose mutarotase [Paenibacillus sp. sptzw28]QYR19568.1 L-rhamnose mutarotase [Paenibacillus sp. sptzw28]
MEKSNKYAWTWRIKEEYIAEYVEMHLNPWPEVLEEHSIAGIRNYSIFQDGSLFFYCFECDDVEKAFAYIARSEVCGRWNAITSKMVEGSFDINKVEPIQRMTKIFYLK